MTEQSNVKVTLQERVIKYLRGIVVLLNFQLFGDDKVFFCPLLEDKQQAKFGIVISHRLCYSFHLLSVKNLGELYTFGLNV